MADEQVTYGPNKSPITKILHSAISSWDGFIYQGCCAICVILEKILEDHIKARDLYLNLEGYDDFAILDANKHILSFHQVKCYKPLNPNFGEDMALMEDKRKYWYDNGICTEDAYLYFHCNRIVNCSHSVSQYQYSCKNPALSPTDILEHIDSLICTILDNNKWDGNIRAKRDSLISLIDEHVNFLDTEFKKGHENDLQLSINNPVSVSKIVDLLENNENYVTIDDRVRTVSFYLNINLKCRIMEEKDMAIDISKVERFLEAYNKLQKQEKKNVVKRLFPHFDVEGKQTNTGDLTNEEVANYLYNVLTQTEEMDLDKIHWATGGHLQSPSTLGSSKPAYQYCGKIVKNRGTLPPELLRDYRWIVGDVRDTIEDIFESAHAINKISDDDYNNISKTRKVGLLSIKDKNNGNI